MQSSTQNTILSVDRKPGVADENSDDWLIFESVFVQIV